MVHQRKEQDGSSRRTRTGPTISATWLTLVPLAAPRYNTFVPGAMKILSIPPNTPAASLLRNGFHTRYSILVLSTPPPPVSTEIRFSPYTDSPGTRFFVTSMDSLPLAIKIPSCLCGSMITVEPPLAPPRPLYLPPRPPGPPRPRPPPTGPPRPRDCTPPPVPRVRKSGSLAGNGDHVRPPRAPPLPPRSPPRPPRPPLPPNPPRPPEAPATKHRSVR